MIGGLIKYFRFSLDTVLWDLGYANMIMLLATIPVFDPDDPEKTEEVKQFDFGDDVQSLGNFLNRI